MGAIALKNVLAIPWRDRKVHVAAATQASGRCAAGDRKRDAAALGRQAPWDEDR